MAVKLAKTAGFCWGVKRAMELALRVSSEENARIRTFGPLIHNRQAIELLKSKQIGQIDSPEQAGEDMMVIIRAHGLAPGARAEILERGARICDATCPHVIRAQKIVERATLQGYDAIVVGDRDHAETIGILGHAVQQSEDGSGAAKRATAGTAACAPAGGRAFAVESVEDLDSLPLDMDKVIVVAQTTQERERFEAVARRISEIWPHAEIHNTVCSDASNRQAELRELARHVDATVVVGGRHSANTTRLAQISRDTKTPTWQVETAEELDLEALRAFQNIGVTAGASTPQWIITSVVERLEALDESKRPLLLRAAAVLARFLVIGQIYLAAGAGLLTWAAFNLLGLNPLWPECLFAALFVMGMHLLHRYLDLPPRLSLLHGSLRYFYSKRHVFLTLCGLSCVGMLVCAAFIHPLILSLAALGLFIGAVYSWATRPVEGEPTGVMRFFKRVRGSKDLFMASAWTAVVVGTPFLNAWLKGRLPPVPEFFMVCAAFFLLVFIRSILVDLRDIDDDLIVGRETLPTVIGQKATLRLIGGGIVLLTVTLAAALWRAHEWPSTFLVAPAVAYVIFNVFLTRRQTIRHGTLWDALIDGQILVVAAVIVFFG